LQKDGGITRYTNELVSGYAHQGHTVVLFMHPHSYSYPPPHKNIQVIYIKPLLEINNRLSRYIDYFFCKPQITGYFKKNNIQSGIFHSTYFTFYKDSKIPQIMTIYDLTREKFPKSFNYIINKVFRTITKKSLQESDAIICISKQTANDLCSYYKIEPNKTDAIYLGVNPTFNIKTQEKKDSFKLSKKIFKPYILFVGKRSTYKNFKKFTEAYADWEHKNKFSLVTIGGGKFTKKESNSMEKLGLNNNIISFDLVTEKELVMFYNCTHSFVFPSLSEGFGLPLLEAMSCGTTILVSDIPVFQEIAGDIPYYFDPYSKESIVKALDNSMVKNQSKIDDGLELVKKFTWENTVKKTIKVYEKLLK